MKTFRIALALTAVALLALMISSTRADDKKSDDNKENTVPPALNFKMKSLTGQDVDLSKYQGKVVLMINVASKCGNTPQYAGLEKLYEKYKGDGLVILGFPANDFGKQEPGSDSDIATFCKANYGVTFDMFSKIVVKGDGQAPLYKFLTSADSDPKFAGPVTWNFEKFLVSRDGQVVNRFAPKTQPSDEKLIAAIESELDKKASKN